MPIRADNIGRADYIRLDFSNLPVSPVTNGFALNGADTLELWFNGSMTNSWTVPVPSTATPMGLLLVLTVE